MSCPQFRHCSECCCPRQASTERYPHIRYTPAEETGGGTATFPLVPLEKIFGLQQPRAEYAVHPQISEVVTQQPFAAKEGTTLTHSKRFSSHMSFSGCPLPDVGSRRMHSLGEKDSHRQHSRLAEKIYSARSQSPTPDILPIPKQTDLTPEEATTVPTLQFSVYYDFQLSTLNVHLLKANNLPSISPELSTKKKKPLSTFVVLYLDPSKDTIVQSSLVPDLSNPVFNEQFGFTNLSAEKVHRESIVFHIYQGTKPSKKRLIGSVVVPISLDIFGAITTTRIDTSGEKKGGSPGLGDVLISLMYNPISQDLKGTVVKATGLQKQDVLRLADPYVKVRLMHKGTRQAKWRTSVKSNTLTPVFNESFRFDVSHKYIQDFYLELEAMEHDRFTQDHLVGSFIIGEHALTESGREHWNETLSSPRVAICRWHSILPPPQT